MESPTEPMQREERPHSGAEERVTPLELFFDLVFVLSFTQVTIKMPAFGRIRRRRWLRCAAPRLAPPVARG